MARPKGSGVLKKIAAEQKETAAEQKRLRECFSRLSQLGFCLVTAAKEATDILKSSKGRAVPTAFEIRRTLHAGAEPVRARHAQLFVRWRDLNALCDAEPTKRDRWTPKRMRERRRARDLTWRQFCDAFRDACAKDATAATAALNEAVRQASAPAVYAYAWRAEATRLLEAERLLESNDNDVSPLAGAAVNVTFRELSEHLSEHLRKHGLPRLDKRQLRRFVRDDLQVTLRDERGERHDLRHRS